MESRTTKAFLDDLFVERRKEPVQYRGAFDKGVHTYFSAMAGLHYTFDELLQMEVNRNMPEFQSGLVFDALRLKSYFRGINASIDISTTHQLDDNQDEIVYAAYVERTGN